MKTPFLTVLFFISIIFFSCLKKEPSFPVFENFKLQKYLGKWYEIARLDHSFEKGMSNVTAQYSLKENGSIKVTNKGLKKNGKWSTAIGKAKFRSDTSKAALKVSFFGPFYGAYNIIDMDSNYENALVLGDDSNYCWILSRANTMDTKTLNLFLNKASQLGIDTTELIYVRHDKN